MRGSVRSLRRGHLAGLAEIAAHKPHKPRNAAPKKKARCSKNSGLSNGGSSTWARTRDLRINSPALYQLSYRGTSLKLYAMDLPILCVTA